MATLTKHLLSVSLSGIGIHVTSTNPIEPISFHKAGASMSNFDEVYVYGTNISSATVTLTSIWGLSAWNALPQVQNSLAAVLTIPANTRTAIANGRLIQNGLSACAYVSTAGTVVLDGYVNRITA